MTGLLKLIFFVVILGLVRYVLSRLFGGTRRGPSRTRARASTRTISGKMVKDPQCGTYVASELAIAARIGGETILFCSEQCKQEYARLKQGAASGLAS